MIEYPLLLEKFQTILKENTLKFTKQRELVLKFLYENDGHFTPEDIYTLLKQENPDINIGIATVYRTLTLLETSNIASSISFGVQGKKYELGLKKHHDHLICVKCGRLEEIYSPELEEIQRELVTKYGYVQQSHELQIFGLCPECANGGAGEDT